MRPGAVSAFNKYRVGQPVTENGCRGNEVNICVARALLALCPRAVSAFN